MQNSNGTEINAQPCSSVCMGEWETQRIMSVSNVSYASSYMPALKHDYVGGSDGPVTRRRTKLTPLKCSDHVSCAVKAAFRV